MKILLWGDYSGVHQDLKSALLELGHDVIIASTGDDYKNFSNDISIDVDRRNFLTRYQSLQKSFAKLSDYNLNDFDVFQAINPAANGAISAASTLQKIFKAIPIKTMLVAGDDYYVWREMPNDPRFKRWLVGIPKPSIQDLGLSYLRNYYLFGIFNKWFIKNIDAIIPTTNGLYRRSYIGSKKLRPRIGFPVNLKQHAYKANKLVGKVVIFHGVSGRSVKGSDLILSALHQMRDKYPSDISLKIVEKLPFEEYMRELSQSNVVIDQTSGDSLCMNSLYSMALGKVLLTSYDRDLADPDAPAIEIEHSIESITQKLEYVLSIRSEIEKLGYTSRQYVEQHHSHLDIAQKYLNVWREID